MNEGSSGVELEDVISHHLAVELLNRTIPVRSRVREVNSLLQKLGKLKIDRLRVGSLVRNILFIAPERILTLCNAANDPIDATVAIQVNVKIFHGTCVAINQSSRSAIREIGTLQGLAELAELADGLQLIELTFLLNNEKLLA